MAKYKPKGDGPVIEEEAYNALSEEEKAKYEAVTDEAPAEGSSEDAA